MRMGRLRISSTDVKYKDLSKDQDPFEPDDDQSEERKTRNAAIKRALEFRHLHKVFFARSKYIHIWFS